MGVLRTIETFERCNTAAEKLAAITSALGLPHGAGVFYAFSATEKTEAEGAPSTPRRLIMDATAATWWQDYADDPAARLRCPVRKVVRRGFHPVVWREFAERHDHAPDEPQLWEHVWDIGVRAGVTVPIHDAARRSYGSFGVVSFGDRGEFDEWYRLARGDILPLVYYFHHGLSEKADRQGDDRPRLTRRERQCLELVARGHGSKEIARRLGLSPRTIDLHVARAAKRLAARNRIEAVSIALQNDLISV